MKHIYYDPTVEKIVEAYETGDCGPNHNHISVDNYNRIVKYVMRVMISVLIFMMLKRLTVECTDEYKCAVELVTVIYSSCALVCLYYVVICAFCIDIMSRDLTMGDIRMLIGMPSRLMPLSDRIIEDKVVTKYEDDYYLICGHFYGTALVKDKTYRVYQLCITK